MPMNYGKSCETHVTNNTPRKAKHVIIKTTRYYFGRYKYVATWVSKNPFTTGDKKQPPPYLFRANLTDMTQEKYDIGKVTKIFYNTEFVLVNKVYSTTCGNLSHTNYEVSWEERDERRNC